MCASLDDRRLNAHMANTATCAPPTWGDTKERDPPYHILTRPWRRMKHITLRSPKSAKPPTLPGETQRFGGTPAWEIQ